MQLQLRSEHLVLHCILSVPSSIHDIMGRVSVDMFQDPKNKALFEIISLLYMEQKPINLITVFKAAIASKSIHRKELGIEASRLTSAFGAVERMGLADAMGCLVSENIRHEHIDLGSKVKGIAESDGYDPSNVINLLQDHITDNKFKRITNKKEDTNESLLDELEKKMIEANMSGGISGIRTGYHRFDAITGGMHPTNFIVVAARPAAGKSQFGLGICVNASIRGESKGLFISCEMDKVQVMKRLIAIDAGVNGYSLKRGDMNFAERKRFDKSKQRIIASNLRIESGAFTITDVISLIYKLKYSEGLDYVVVDYLQKITSPNAQNRTNEVGEVSRKLKDCANELKIPIIALAQLSRAVEHRVDKKPILSDLRESGDIEQDADIVSFLFRPAYYMDEDERMTSPFANDGYLLIAKHRDGELEDIKLKFDSNVPAWLNPNETAYTEDVFVQTTLQANTEFDNSIF